MPDAGSMSYGQIRRTLDSHLHSMRNGGSFSYHQREITHILGQIECLYPHAAMKYNSLLVDLKKRRNGSE